MELQGLYCIALRHPLTHTTTEILPLRFGMAAPRCPSSPLNDPFRPSPRGTIRRLTPSHRVYMLLSPAIPVWHTSTFWRNRRSTCAIAPRVGFPPRQARPTERGVSRGARDDAFVRAEHLPRAYDARNGACDPRS